MNPARLSILSAAIAAPLILSSFADAAQKNFVTNGDFSQGLTAWNDWDPNNTELTVTAAGTLNVQAKQPSAVYTFRSVSQCVPIPNDQQPYQLEGDVTVPLGQARTGDAYIRDADGYYWYQARADDMIISSGYNIAGPEVEAALLRHPDVLECGVVGAPDAERGMLVTAYVVLREGVSRGDETVKDLQEFVKAEIAPYKYPRRVHFVDELPRTNTGKLQRFRLREMS